MTIDARNSSQLYKEKFAQEGIEIKTIGANLQCTGWHHSHTKSVYYYGNANEYLYYAAENGDLEAFNKALNDGADVNKPHINNNTAIHIATKNGNDQIVDLLIKNGAQVDAPNTDGYTALYTSTSQGHTNITRLLLEAGADKNKIVKGLTPLLSAAHSERVEDVNLLLEYNASALSDHGYTAFNVAQFIHRRTEKGNIIHHNIVKHYLNSLKPVSIDFEVVIARYNEDLDWAIKEFPNEKVTVYNKGLDNLRLPYNFQVIQLENTGREAHTYLYHIVKNYDNLAKTTLFLQGYPYEHPLFLPLARYKQGLNTTCTNIIAKCASSMLIEKSNDLKLQMDKNFKHLKPPYDLVEFTHKFINQEYLPNTILHTVNGAQFAVKKQNILSNSIEYYQQLKSTLLNNISPIEGFYFERIWDLVFASQINLSKSLFQAIEKNDTQQVGTLLELGANVSAVNKNGDTALNVASFYNNPNIINILLKAGATNSSVALTVAAYFGKLQAAEILLESGAEIIADHLSPPLTVAALHQSKTTDNQAVYQLIINHYWNWLKNNPAKINPTSKSFEVVIVRYQEDLSWVPLEFPNEKVTIYNKNNDTINPEYILDSYKVINIPNFGWFGGTILHHIVTNYDHLANRTLFLQANPYDQEVFLPLNRYQNDLPTKCKNIIAKCTETTLFKESSKLVNTKITNPKYKGFSPLNYTAIDFTHRFIDPNYAPDSILTMIWGAEFAVDASNIYRYSKEHYENILNHFQKRFPMEDFYIEKLWDLVFALPEPIKDINSKLFQAATKGNNLEISKLLNMGADINSKHDFGVTALTASSFNGHTTTVELLINNGADINSRGDNGLTALYASTSRGHIEVMRLLLDQKANKELTIKSGTIVDNRTPLYIAIKNNDIEAVKLLLQYNAEILSDDINSLLYMAAINADIERGKTTDIIEKQKAIYELIINHYWNWLEHNPANVKEVNKDFEVVIARYQEDLAWLKKEFPNEKVTIYNKGNDTINPDYLLPSYNVVNIPNFGWFGGTILHHIVNNYDHLADRTLFLQGAPYAVELFLPLTRYKDNLPTKCKNIIAKCIETNLQHESDTFTYQSRIENWNTTKYRHFKHIDYNMIDFAHRYIDPDYAPNSSLTMVWGAEFAVDSSNIYCHDKEYYQNMLNNFQIQYPMEDFFLEKLWDLIFAPSASIINKQLLEATANGDIEKVSKLLDIGADVNYKDNVTALYLAALNGYTEILTLLIDSGADTELATNQGNTPLYAAVYSGHTDLIKLLVEAGAEITSDQYMDPLAIAARLERYEIHQFLLEQYWAKLKQDNLKLPTCDSIPDDNKFEVVISRYNEDISWIKDEFPCDKVTIYNKGDDLPESPYYKEVKLPNVGYGEGSYFYHITQNYHQLADRTLFVQANPYDAYIFLPLSRHKGELNSTCNNIIAKCDPGHNLKAESIAMQKFDWHNGANGKYKSFNYQDNNLTKFAEKFVTAEIPERFPICYAGLFAIDKEVLLNHDLEYYQAISDELNYRQYPIEAFYLDRLWDLIFDSGEGILFNQVTQN